MNIHACFSRNDFGRNPHRFRSLSFRPFDRAFDDSKRERDSATNHGELGRRREELAELEAPAQSRLDQIIVAYRPLIGGDFPQR
jgi:hypothetical protein